jgi:WD40 repeat protein
VGEVFLYKFENTKAWQNSKPLLPLPVIPSSFTNNPIYVAFSSRGELFVTNRHDNRSGGAGSISRFVLDMDGNFIPNGTITGNGLEAVHGIAFSPEGELFAVNYIANTVSRFLFDVQGNAISNGTFSSRLQSTLGLAFSSSGELFVTSLYPYTPTVQRFVFDPETGEAIPNGNFLATGGSGLPSLAFSPDGELFVASLYNDKVFRYMFNEGGEPVANGSISAPGGPSGVAFSSSGELFVTTHLDPSGTIYRFLFDEFGNAISNGTETVGVNLGGVAIYEPNMCGF